jgi:hypothetical protein
MAIIDQGRVLFAGSPSEALSSIRNRIWSSSVPKQRFQELSSQLPVISTRMVAGQPIIHVFGDRPPMEGFSQVEGDLEDVFFSHIKGFNKAVEA